MPPKIGVIIVSYNSRQYLDGLFLSLSKVKYQNWSIIFVDNASPDDSVAYITEKFAANFPNLTIMRVDNNSGFAIGNNIGLKYLAENNFDYAYLLNQDTEVEPDFLEKALEKAGEGVGSVQSFLKLYNKNGEINSLGNTIHYLGLGYCCGYRWSEEKTKKYLEDWQKRDPELNITYGSGAGILFNMKALQKVGFFDDIYFLYHEDLDLGWRLRLAGYKNILAPESIVYHKYEFSRSIKKFYWMERNRFLTIFKNYSAWTLIVIFPALFVMELGLFFFSFFSGWWREKLRVYEYFLEIKNWKMLLKSRKKTQALRRVGDAEITKYFVGEILFQDMDNFILRRIANPIFNLYWRFARHLLGK